MKLVVDNVSRGSILKGVSFYLNQGDKVALVGLNGAGKTTILNIMMGLLTPSTGKIIKTNVKLATVFQNNVLDDDLTVIQNLRFRIKNKEKIKSIQEKMKNLKINESLRYSSLSGGQKRIVNYLRAIAVEPNCLLLDEMSAGIDVDIRQLIWNDLDEYLKENNCGVLFTTHLLSELENANKIIFVSNGTVKYFGEMVTFMNKISKVKLILNKTEDDRYFNTSAEAVRFIEDNHLINENFEIRKATYTDLFKNMEEGI